MLLSVQGARDLPDVLTSKPVCPFYVSSSEQQHVKSHKTKRGLVSGTTTRKHQFTLKFRFR